MEISLNNAINIPLRGEIWFVALDPAVGSEMKKTRPALVMSSDAISGLGIKLVAPITEWKQKFTGNIWHVRIDPDSQNNLEKPSAVNVLQRKGLDNKRFVKLLGKASAQVVEEAVTALAAVVEYQ